MHNPLDPVPQPNSFRARVIRAIFRGVKRVIEAKLLQAFLLEFVLVTTLFSLVYHFWGPWLCKVMCPGVKRG